MHFHKLEASDEETRWINLQQVSRVTLAIESPRNEQIMVITFADADPDARLTIRASNETNRRAIASLIAALDELSGK